MTISDLDKLEGVEFEQALKAPLSTVGFSEITFTPKTADFGADVIAKKEGKKCAIQVKRSTSPISISAVQEVLGALNEGIDVPDANMVVFLRNSESPVVFLQQLGRGLRKSSSKKRVIVLDFVCNIDRIRYVYSFCSKLKNYYRNETSHKATDAEPVPESTVQFDEQARDIVQALLAKKVSSGLLVPLSAIVTALDYSIEIKTLKKISSLGHIIADYDLPGKNGGLEQYFESDTVRRFIRQVLRKQDNPTLFDENYVSKLIKRKPTDLHRMEKWGQLAPSWFHKTPSGRVLFYYSEADIAELRKLTRA